MAVDERLLRGAREAGARWVGEQRRAEFAKADYHHAIRRLHFAGASLREIAEALNISHQRVHQIIEATGGTRGWKPRKRATTERACTFCGLPEAVVANLIAGPGVYICNGCVALTQQIVAEARPVETDRTRLQRADPTSRARCSFCGKAARDVTSLVMGPGVRICNGCVRLCGEILSEE